jgi:2-keto-4-pentenoate hydratase/2-oxohepta-3-ene-1,7-dioic acid hydratase in catechol pathway
MRLVRVGDPGAERAGVLVDESRYLDVHDEFGDFNPAFFGANGLERLRARLADPAGLTPLPLDGQRLGPPIARPNQIVCVGLNYAEHAEESGEKPPGEPVIFTKASNSLSGPYDPVYLPPGGSKLDYEVELGVVIGRTCRYLPDSAAAMDAIAGYVAVNDISERAFQLERSGQWFIGKSAETFNPCGPYLVTPDEIADVDKLELCLTVNGAVRQSDKTSRMIFGIGRVIHYISQFTVLEPGDLVNTGTPSGVGLGMDPPGYLQVGDELTLTITGLGTQRYRISSPVIA